MTGLVPGDCRLVDSLKLYKKRCSSNAADDPSKAGSEAGAVPKSRLGLITDSLILNKNRLMAPNVSQITPTFTEVPSLNCESTVNQDSVPQLGKKTSAPRQRRHKGREREESSYTTDCTLVVDAKVLPTKHVTKSRHQEVDSEPKPSEPRQSSEVESTAAFVGRRPIEERRQRIRSRRPWTADGQSSEVDDCLTAQPVDSRVQYSGPLFVGRYQWQTRRDGRAWKNVDRSTSEAIELSFCDVKNDSLTIKTRKTAKNIEFFFDERIFRQETSHGEIEGRLRRLEVGIGDDVDTLIGLGLLKDTMWQWYWESAPNVWQAYDSQYSSSMERTSSDVEHCVLNDRYLTSAEIESRYSSDHRKSRPHFRCTIRRNGQPELNYRIDFERMIQVNLATDVERRIRRRPAWFRSSEIYLNHIIQTVLDLSDIAAACPAVWSSNPASVCGSRYQLIPVFNADSMVDEYLMVARLFLKSLSSSSPRTIWRIQNRDLWKEFVGFRRQMEKRSGRKVDPRRLFHGTNTRSVWPICEQGFDFRISGLSVGTKYGKGSYFASSAKFSDDYTDCKKMFLVQVLVGRCARGEPDMVRPPPIDPSRTFNDLYDTCVDNVDRPEIFVTFDVRQSYPEYLIEY